MSGLARGIEATSDRLRPGAPDVASRASARGEVGESDFARECLGLDSREMVAALSRFGLRGSTSYVGQTSRVARIVWRARRSLPASAGAKSGGEGR